MNVVGFMALGALASLALWFGFRSRLSRPRFMRANYDGRMLCAVGGVPLVLGSLVIVTITWFQDGPAIATAVLGVGFGALGLLDDVVGSPQRRGFRGHLRALREGVVTTGLVKLVGGLVVAAFAVWQATCLSDPSRVELVRDVLLVALAANVGNLFDRAPGRCIKVAALGLAIAAVVAASPGSLRWPATVVGAGIGLLWFDLRERLMLGDTGSNVLGAAVGLGVVVSGSGLTRWVTLGLVVGLNAAAERLSFSQVIDRVGPLRFLDRWGSFRRRE